MDDLPGIALNHDFSSRQDRIDSLRESFPDESTRDSMVSPIIGGRRAAVRALAGIRVHDYPHTRNLTSGAVTRLSPYITHGVLELAEVRDAVFERNGGDLEHKLINELAWRDYFQRVYGSIGTRIWSDLEPSKLSARVDHSDRIPEDLLQAKTGLACIDAFVQELYATGYLHNHARMWVASYLVHWRGVAWQVGARWFLTHLLDGDPASNNLSWQWVASTFASKPYFFNRENLERNTQGTYCTSCPVRGHCDFEGDYATLEARLFRAKQSSRTPTASIQSGIGDIRHEPQIGIPAVIWVHDDDLNPVGPALSSALNQPAIHIWDDESLRRQALGLKRVVFLSECLTELSVHDRRGTSEEILAAFARKHGAGRIVMTETLDPRRIAIKSAMERMGFVIELRPHREFVPLAGQLDLSRFSRYWNRARVGLRKVARPSNRIAKAEPFKDSIAD